MQKTRRHFLFATLLSPLSLLSSGLEKSSTSFPVTFTWLYTKPMTSHEAQLFETKYLNVPKLYELNKEFQKRGWIKNMTADYYPDRAVYVYTFSSLWAYTLWGFRKNSMKLIDYAYGRESYKIVNSLHPWV